MSSSLYGKGAYKVAAQQLNFLTDTIRVALVANTYTLDLTNHEFYSSISAHVVGAEPVLANKTITAGAGKAVHDADDLTVTGLVAGSTIIGAVLYKDTGVEATSPLLAFIDTVDLFPYITNGNNLLLQWDNTGGGDGIYAI